MATTLAGSQPNLGAYATVGPYTHGLWLVKDNATGAGAVVNHANLPPEGTGFTYYWLGTTYNRIRQQIDIALTSLGVKTDYLDANGITKTINNANANGSASLPGQPSGVLGAIKSALEGGFAVPGGTLGAGEGVGAEGATAGAEGGAAGAGTAAGAGAAIAAGAGVASLATTFGFLASLQFWKGIGLVLAGAAILVFAALEFRKLA